MGINETIRNRRSTRTYSSKKISNDDLSSILEAARWAPSGLNNQPWRFKVLKGMDKDVLAGFTKYAGIIKGAQIAVCVFLDKNSSYNRDKDILAVGACIQNILLQAQELGIGTCWLGEILNKKEEVNAVLKLSADYELMAVVTLGYPAELKEKGLRKKVQELILTD